MYHRLPDERPPTLRRRSLPAGTVLWRIDTKPAATWEWHGYPKPSHRFDSATGAFRTRYAGSSIAGAARERYLGDGCYIPPDHADHFFVRLEAVRRMSVIDLRTEANLDALGVDDRISTGHEPAVWQTCHRLVDLARTWWDELDGIVFRSRTTPTTSYNLAFFAHVSFDVESRKLGTCAEELDDLVLHHRFTVGFDW